MPKRNAYDPKSLEAAVKDVNDGILSKKAAAKKYGVPRATIQFRLSDKFVKSSCGPNTILSKEDEQLLEKWIIDCARKGFPKRKDDLLLSVQDFLNKAGRKTIFKDNLPGKGWYKAFLTRHPNLRHRESEAVTRASANVSEADIRGWFQSISAYLNDVNAQEILNDPSRVYNGDETNFLLCPKNSKVIAVKGSKNVYEVDQGISKAAVTCMFTFSASGQVVPPMIIYPYVRIPAEISSSVPDSWGIGHSESGWMKSELFYEYVANVFNKFLIDNEVKRPVILFVDGHKSHLTYHLSQLCTELEIILVALYPNATRILQPADVSAFKPIKSEWKKGVLKWRRTHINDAITKENIAPILKDVVNTIKPETLKHGFKACGLVPWNPNQIDFSKCLGKGSKLPVPVESNSSITLEQFNHIVGNELLTKFQNIEDIVLKEETTPEFFTLYRVWEEFSRQDCFNEMPVATRTETTQTSSTKPNKDYEKEHTLADDKIIEQNIHHPSTVSHKNDGLSAYLDHTYSTPSKNVKEEQLKRNKDAVFELRSDNSEDKLQSISLKRLDSGSSGLSDVLLWPETPKRKGRKVTERVPFVVSSKQWKMLFEEKEAKKKSTEQEKEERKRKREEKKLEPKPAKKTKKNPDRLKVKKPEIKELSMNIKPTCSTSKDYADGVFDDQKLGLCYKCGNNFKLVDSQTKVECDLCNKTFHKSCLDNYELEEDNNMYVCKDCLTLGEFIEKELKI